MSAEKIHDGFKEFCQNHAKLYELIFLTDRSIEHLVDSYAPKSGSHGLHTFLQPSMPMYRGKTITIDIRHSNQQKRKQLFIETFNRHLVHLLATAVEQLIQFESVIKTHMEKPKAGFHEVLDRYPKIIEHSYYPEVDGTGYDFIFSWYFLRFLRNKIFHNEHPFTKNVFEKEVSDKFIKFLGERRGITGMDAYNILRACRATHCKRTVIQREDNLDFRLLNDRYNGWDGQAKDLFEMIGEIAFIWYVSICEHHNETPILPSEPKERPKKATRRK